MAGLKFLALGLAATAVGLGEQPAAAQCRLCSTPTTAPDATAQGKAIEVQIESSINFDRLILSRAGEGAAVIWPDGSSSAQGAIESLSARAMVGSATVHGEPGRAVRIDLPRQITLHSLSGGQIIFDDLVSDLPSAPRLDSAGNLSFRFGAASAATAKVASDLGLSFDITPERAIVRLGAIHAAPSAIVASTASPSTGF